MNGKNSNLKPQDIIIIMKIISKGKNPWKIADLAYELGLSSGELSNGLERLKTSELIDSTKKIPMRSNLKDFLFFGLKYAFPARIGKYERGVLTAHSYGVMRKKIVSETKYVWPHFEGTHKGISVSPLFKNAAEASLSDEKLHQYLALIDCIRVGKVREKKIAMEILEKELIV